MANRGNHNTRAVAALVEYGGDREESLTDLLTDLMHYVGELRRDREIGRTFDELLGTARMHYAAES